MHLLLHRSVFFNEYSLCSRTYLAAITMQHDYQAFLQHSLQCYIITVLLILVFKYVIVVLKAARKFRGRFLDVNGYLMIITMFFFRNRFLKTYDYARTITYYFMQFIHLWIIYAFFIGQLSLLY